LEILFAEKGRLAIVVALHELNARAAGI